MSYGSLVCSVGTCATVPWYLHMWWHLLLSLVFTVYTCVTVEFYLVFTEGTLSRFLGFHYRRICYGSLVFTVGTRVTAPLYSL